MSEVERARRLWADGNRRGALELLKGRVRAQPTDAPARLELVEFYREMGAPDQAGRWGITLDGIVTDFEKDRLARMLAGTMWWGGEASDILALPRGRRADAVEELLSGPVEEYRQRMRDRHPALVVAPDRNGRALDAAIISWIATVVVLLIGLFGLWVISGLRLLDASFVARALAALLGVSVGVSLLLSGVAAALERDLSSIWWLAAGGLLIVATITTGVLTRFTFVFET